MLGLIPIFSLEENGLYPLDKVRNLKQIIEYYQCFISEFDDPCQIALMMDKIPTSEDRTIITDFIRQSFPDVVFSINTINETNIALFGPQTTGLFLIDENMMN